MQLDEDQKKEIRENRKLVEQNIHRSAVFQRVFRGPDGELVLGAIDTCCGYKADTFPPSSDPYEHAYNAGRRSAAVFIHTALEDDPEKYRKILDAENKTE